MSNCTHVEPVNLETNPYLKCENHLKTNIYALRDGRGVGCNTSKAEIGRLLKVVAKSGSVLTRRGMVRGVVWCGMGGVVRLVACQWLAATQWCTASRVTTTTLAPKELPAPIYSTLHHFNEQALYSYYNQWFLELFFVIRVFSYLLYCFLYSFFFMSR